MRNVLVVSCSLVAAAGVQAGETHQATLLQNQLLLPGGQVNFSFNMSAGEITAFMTTPLAGLPLTIRQPDTFISLRDSTDTVIVENDDGGTDGSGGVAGASARGSLIRYFAPTAGAFNYRVEGFDAAQAGPYAATFVRFTPGGTRDFTDAEGNNTVASAQPIAITTNTARLGMGSLTAGDLDVFAITVNAGDIISAFTIPLSSLTDDEFSTPDTLLQIRDISGNIIIEDDDAGDDAVGTITGTVRGSAIRYQALTAGTIFLSVEGFDADVTGDYALGLSVVAIPTPGAMGLLLTGLPLLARRRR
jgi:hypothetical protein